MRLYDKLAIHGKLISYSVIQCSTVQINIRLGRGSPSPLVSGAEVYNVWCMPFWAVRRTRVDSSYGRRNTDPITVMSGETEKVRP